MFENIYQYEKTNTPFAIVTILSFTGVVSRKSGRMIVTLSGDTSGTIGGGEHEREAKERAIECIKSGRNAIFDIQVKNSGSIKVMVDVVIKDRAVVIIGSGNIALSITKVFLFLSWNVTLIDKRKDAFKSDVYNNARCIVTDNIIESLNEVGINKNTAIISTTPEVGIENLEELKKTDAFYIGILSSRKKSGKVIDDERVYIPSGITLGEETPEEIAISISSEVLGVYNKKRVEHNKEWRSRLIVVKGGGDLATGTIIRLRNAGYKCVVTEIEKPTTIRRSVSFSEAVYEGEKVIEGVKCKKVNSLNEVYSLFDDGVIPLIVDEKGECIKELKPNVVIDAIIAKKNINTRIDDAPLTIALGPGFSAGKDVDVVIETMRGHYLGEIIRSGSALPNTGIPGSIEGKGKERVVHSPCSGLFCGIKHIGDIVKKGEVIAKVGSKDILSPLDGKLRGLLHDNIVVPEGFKIADVDPRGEKVDHSVISDKARTIAGGVLEVVDNFFYGNK